MALDIELTVGTLPPPACYADEQARADAIIAATTATASGGIQWQASTTAPTDHTMYWLVIDVNGRPLDICKWSDADAAWVRVLSTVVWCGDATGTNSNYEVAPVPVFTTTAAAYQYGRVYAFKVPHTTTGAATLNVNSLGQRAITKFGTTALVAGDLVVNQMAIVIFDGTRFQLLCQIANLTVAVANITPGTEDQFLSTTATPAAAWLTRNYDTPAGLEQAIPAAGSSVTFAHGLTKGGVAIKPRGFQVKLRCTAGPANGYAQDDEVDVNSAASSGGTNWCSIWADETVVGLVFDSGATGPYISAKSGGASGVANGANWKLAASAYW